MQMKFPDFSEGKIMLWGHHIPRGLNNAGAILLIASLATPHFAQAKEAKEQVLYSFCSQWDCFDGNGPLGGVVADRAGNLYGTTYIGGANGAGVVFKLTPDGKETVLHAFCSEADCSDGNGPFAGPIVDNAGNLYGTTYQGGKYGYGTVFKVRPNRTESALYSFCRKANCKDGQLPEAGLIADSAGNLYGTTFAGGGTVFSLTPDGKETVLHSFCSRFDCQDGWAPATGLIADGAGNLYGATEGGGRSLYDGTVFKVAPDGSETVLHSFCHKTNCADGSDPRYGQLTMDSAGNLFGATSEGGKHGHGAVFKLTPDGAATLLYSFCHKANCTDGAKPLGGLILDRAGNLYGTTNQGGKYNRGTVFEVAADGTETVLHSFCSDANCADGDSPFAGLMADHKGDLYGTTPAGGANLEGGVVFKISLKQR